MDVLKSYIINFLGTSDPELYGTFIKFIFFMYYRYKIEIKMNIANFSECIYHKSYNICYYIYLQTFVIHTCMSIIN